MLHFVFALALTMLISGPSLAQIGHKVTFENRYFNQRVDVTAYLSYPDQRKDRYPVMIIVPSQGDLHGRDWENVEMLNKMGVATLVVDSFGSRGLKNLPGNKRSFGEINEAGDIESAIRFLMQQPNIGTLRIGTMGRSLGGGASLTAVLEDWREKNGVRSARPALVISIYPGCITTGTNARVVSRIVMFLAGKDDFTPAQHCIEYGERMKVAGGDVEWIVYPNAFHGFDTRPTPTFVSSHENYAACRSEIPREIGAGLYRSDTRQLLKGDEIERYMASCRTMGGMIGGDPIASKEMDEKIAMKVRKTLLRE